MQVELEKEQYKLIKTIAETNGFQVYKLDVQRGSKKGDGYMGGIISVVIKNGKNELKIILKIAPKQGDMIGIPIRVIYLKEICIYEKVFASFEKFQTDNGLMNGFKGYAKFYGKCDKEHNELLALENLVADDYKLWNKKIPMNAEHIALIMAEYGKLHSVSLAMRYKNPELFKEVTKFLVEPDSKEGRQILNNFIGGVSAIVSQAVEGNVKAENAFKRLMVEAQKFFTEDLFADENYFVVTHGDCWCNNLLFKYEDPNNNKKPSQVRLIDWQLSRLANPVMDISYSLCVNGSLEITYDYMKYLKIYHDSLSHNLRSMSCDPEEIYPFSLLEDHWRKYAKYALFWVPLIINIIYMENEEAPKLSESTIFTEDIKKQRIMELYVFMDKHGLV